jgi:hypothetical protein
MDAGEFIYKTLYSAARRQMSKKMTPRGRNGDVGDRGYAVE